MTGQGEGESRMQITLLGDVALVLGGEPVAFSSAKERHLLGVLGLMVNKPVTVATLIEALWDEPAPDKARKHLQSYVSRLRTKFKSEDLPAKIAFKTDSYVLEIDPLLVDYHRFLNLAAQARGEADRGRTDMAAELYEDALRLWKHTPFTGLGTPWADRRRQTMNAEHLTVCRERIGNEMHLHRYELALKHVEELLEHNEFDERLIRLKLDVLAACGLHREITDYYLSVYRRMHEELGIPPSTSLAEHHQQILNRTKTREPRPAKSPSAPGSPSPAARQPVISPPRQLPPDVRDFVGRTEQLCELDTLVPVDTSLNDYMPIALLHGPPGVGKTALVTHWAHRAKHLFPDGQVFLNLNGYGSIQPTAPADLLGSLLVALGCPSTHLPSGTAERTAQLRTATADRRLLVLLDNAGSSEQVLPLLPSSSGCMVIVTSRARLTGLVQHMGAHDIDVQPLPDADAQILLTRLTPRRVYNDDTQLADALALFSGFPLAVRIAASRLNQHHATPLDELITALRDRIGDWAGGDGDSPSLYALFSWTYKQLPNHVQAVFRSVGVHSGSNFGGGSVAAATALSNNDVHQALEHLAATHLVEPIDLHRYRAHDLLRTYAATLLRQSGEYDAVLNRYLDWYLHTANNADTVLAPSKDPLPLHMLAPEVRPLTFAGHDAATAWFVAEVNNLIEAVHLAHSEGWHRHAWRLASAIRDLLGRHALYRDSRTIAELALTSAREAREPRGEAASLNDVALAHLHAGDTTEASKLFADALTIARGIGDLHTEATCLHNLAVCHRKIGEHDRALDLLREVLQVRESAVDVYSLGFAYHAMALTYRAAQEYDEAERHHHLAIDTWQPINCEHGKAITLTALADLHLATNEPLRAIDVANSALMIHQPANDIPYIIQTQLILARAHVIIRRLNEARLYATHAVELAQKTNNAMFAADALYELGNVHHESGDTEAARASWAQALVHYQAMNSPRASDITALL